MELSSVTIPANPNALQLALASGIVTEDEYKHFVEPSTEDLLQNIHNELTHLSKALSPDSDEFKSMMDQMISARLKQARSAAKDADLSDENTSNTNTVADLREFWNKVDLSDLGDVWNNSSINESKE